MWQPIVASDGGRPHVEHAALVCSSCRNRKKRCDKTLPCCGYCARKGLSCVYEEVRPQNHVSSALDNVQPVAAPHFIPLGPISSEAELYLEVHRGLCAHGICCWHPPRDTDFRLRAEEANTWWGIIICERIISCDVTVHGQPLVTTIPNAAFQLPTEPEVLEQSHIPSPESNPPLSLSSSLNSVDIGAFGRSAQAAWFLDQALKAFHIPSLDTKLLQLHEIDTELQRFLGTVVHPCYNGTGVLCETIAMAIRTLFTLHWHILSQRPQTLNPRYGSLEDWCSRSDAALDTATKMVVDIVENNNNMEAYSFDDVAPSYTYIIRASLAHARRRTQGAQGKPDSWLRSAKERLRVALEQFNQRWDLDPPPIA